VYRIALIVGIAAAIFGLVRNWDLVMWGGAAMAGAAACGLFVQRHPVLFAVIGGGLALGIAGVLIWHLRLKGVKPDAALPSEFEP
jgi:hypothetical protein